MALTRPKSSNIVDSDYKQSCRVVVTTNITLAGGAPNVYDDVTLVAGDRVLVKTQDTTSQNGIYTVLTPGTGSNGTWIRSFDANDGTRLTGGTQVAISEGPNAGKIYRLVTPDPIVINTTPLTWIAPNGNPGGGNTHVQFNSTGSLEGSPNFTFDKYAGQLTLIGNILVANISVSSHASILSTLTVGGNIVAGNIDTNNITSDGFTQLNTLSTSGPVLVGGSLIVDGNLTVNGTSTVLNTSELEIEDKTITLAKGATDTVAANGSGISIDGANATFTYASADDSWNVNKKFNIPSLSVTNGVLGSGTGTTYTFTNFSTSNARVTGGSITGVTGSASTLVATNFSTGNAVVTGGSIDSITNFSTSNALITGGSITDVTGSASTLVATNFSTGNAVVTGGSITDVTGSASTLVATNFSTGNAVVTGGSIVLSAGTASVPPLDFTAGTLNSSPITGAMEYDGKVFYTTPDTRGISPSLQHYVLNANRGLAASTATQSLFNVDFAVKASTRYYFDAYFAISKTNLTANSLAFALILNGGATLSSLQFSAMTKWAAARTTIAALNIYSNRVTASFNTLLTVSAASAAAAATVDARIQGFFDVSVAGTINPQVALITNAPTAPTVLAQSYWRMYPVGPISANTSVL